MLLLFSWLNNDEEGVPQNAQLLGTSSLVVGSTDGEYSAPYWWFVEIEIPIVGQVIRMVNNTKAVTYLTDQAAQPIEWSPGNFQVENLKADAEGNISSIAISVQNVTREIQAWLEHFAGLQGSPVRLILASQAELAVEAPIIDYRGEILFSSSTAEVVTFEVGQFNLQRRFFPAKRIQRDFCRHAYAGVRCGYAVPMTSANYLPTCDKTKDGVNGCTVHGLSEQDEGLTVLHPRRFGGFPGLTRSSGIGVR